MKFNFKKILIQIVRIIWIWMLLTAMCFWMDNLIGVFHHGNLNYALTAVPNSHTANMILSTLLIITIPGFLALFKLLSTRTKLFKNIFIIGLFGMLIIYVVELTAGLIMNVWLDFNAWDYSNMNLFGVPVHIMGQINLFYAPIWFSISILLKPFSYTFFFFDDMIADKFVKDIGDTFKIMFKNKGKIDDNYYDVFSDLYKK